jgi:hypothetical protein
MSTKNINNSKEETKLTKCENCRQDIISEKMFLHEGFCHRNNVFCEHCQKVFLKTDYEQHIKDLPKNLTSEKKESSSTNTQKSTSNDEEPAIIKNTINVNPNPSLEYVQMPLVEEYTINAPIIISENGQIVSNKNKNEYILPFLGINPVSNYNIYQNKNIYQMNMPQTYTVEDLKRFLGTNNEQDIAQIFELNNNQIKQNNITNNINFYNNNQLNDFNYDINYTNQNTNTNNFNNYSNEVNKNLNNNNKKYSKIISYNKNKVNNNDFQQFQSPKRILKKVNITNNNDKLLYPKDKNEKIPKNCYIEKSPENRINRVNYNNFISDSKSKEPMDSKRKILTEPRQCVRKNYKTENKNILVSEQKKKMRKLCEYCKIMVEDLSSHYNTCKSKKNNKSKEIKNKDLGDSISYFEILENQNFDECGIEDNKKKILNREFVSSLQPNKCNSENISSGKVCSLSKKRSKIRNELNEEPKALNIKKKLFPKVTPLELNKERLIKTQERNYRDKYAKKITKNENPKSVKKIQKPPKNNYIGKSPIPINRRNRTAFLTEFRNYNGSDRKDYYGKSKDSFDNKCMIRI